MDVWLTQKKKLDDILNEKVGFILIYSWMCVRIFFLLYVLFSNCTCMQVTENYNVLWACMVNKFQTSWSTVYRFSAVSGKNIKMMLSATLSYYSANVIIVMT